MGCKRWEYGPRTICAGCPSSLGFGAGGQLIFQLVGFYCRFFVDEGYVP